MVSQVPDYESLALEVVERDVFYSEVCNPKPEHVFIGWRGEVYKGTLQRFLREKPEIVFMTKSSHPYENELVDAIRKIDPAMKDFTAEDGFDISSTCYLAQNLGDMILQPTDEQLSYFKEKGPKNVLSLDISL